jgi:hypothetical protein
MRTIANALDRPDSQIKTELEALAVKGHVRQDATDRHYYPEPRKRKPPPEARGE